LAQIACPLSDVMFYLYSVITNLSLYKHWFVAGILIVSKGFDEDVSDFQIEFG
jgi:hypothetical protein